MNRQSDLALVQGIGYPLDFSTRKNVMWDMKHQDKFNFNESLGAVRTRDKLCFLVKIVDAS